MKFILELWPDTDDGSPEGLLRFAVDSIRNNPDLRWDIVGDTGSMIAENVCLPDRLSTPGKTYDHEPQPDDGAEPGNRCRSCGEDITWVGPGHDDWLHVDDKENR